MMIWVLTTIDGKGAVRSWGPFESPHNARRQMHTFKQRERELGHPGDTRYVVTQVLDPATEPIQEF